MSTETKKFADSAAVASGFAADFAEWVAAQGHDKITVALSGGSTPKLLFGLWASDYADKIEWARLHFFWGDERCVEPDDSDSNYGVAKALFLDKVQIPEENVHRILGEADPDEERLRYENEVYGHVDIDDNAVPEFDLIILGMGTDGHTASIFPHQSQFLKSPQVCEVAIHPETAQKRITLTGPVLNRGKKVAFLITGGDKAEVLAQVIKKEGDFANFPASHVEAADLTFYVDEAAAARL
ncbi:6-phosphogluconolactonase [Rhodopirellula maiorica SM1]|uniref:6-phosphogluconolactonase n=1 Tax=Rhodopirellula maiorica SM1 TaxID=1265738 RepID=M5S0P9_9BACT|nr:6-phosphogluconolactonase [Rhodopirellula maiorica]EMI19734.1 6-phosphogluconolactonase [Rhodopirellula maiorica SM1]